LKQRSEASNVPVLVESRRASTRKTTFSGPGGWEEAGAHVIYGSSSETHAKLTLVSVRTEGLRRYVISGPETQPNHREIYTDLCLFTSNPTLERFFELFNYLTGYSGSDRLSQADCAPVRLRDV